MNDIVLRIFLFLCLEDDLLCFHIIEQIVPINGLTHWQNFVCHKATNVGQSLAFDNEKIHLLEQTLLLPQLLQSLWENAFV